MYDEGVESGCNGMKGTNTCIACIFTCAGLVKGTDAASKYKGHCNEIHHTHMLAVHANSKRTHTHTHTHIYTEHMLIPERSYIV